MTIKKKSNKKQKTQECNTCKKEKPLSDYHKNANRKKGYHADCKECRKDERKKHYSIHGIKRRLYQHFYRLRHKKIKYFIKKIEKLINSHLSLKEKNEIEKCKKEFGNEELNIAIKISYNNYYKNLKSRKKFIKNIRGILYNRRREDPSSHQAYSCRYILKTNMRMSKRQERASYNKIKVLLERYSEKEIKIQCRKIFNWKEFKHLEKKLEEARDEYIQPKLF